MRVLLCLIISCFPQENCRGVSHTPFTWAKLPIQQPSRYPWNHRKCVGAYRIRPSWRWKGTFDGGDVLGDIISFSLIWGRMRYAPTPVRLIFGIYWVAWWFHFCPHQGVCDTPLLFSFVLYLMSVERPHYLQLGIKKCKSFGFSFFPALTLHYLCIVWAIN